MSDKVSEDKPKETMGAGGVEGAVAESASSINGRESAEVKVCRYDHIEGNIVFRWS